MSASHEEPEVWFDALVRSLWMPNCKAVSGSHEEPGVCRCTCKKSINLTVGFNFKTKTCCPGPVFTLSPSASQHQGSIRACVPPPAPHIKCQCWDPRGSPAPLWFMCSKFICKAGVYTLETALAVFKHKYQVTASCCEYIYPP